MKLSIGIRHEEETSKVLTRDLNFVGSLKVVGNLLLSVYL